MKLKNLWKYIYFFTIIFRTYWTRWARGNAWQGPAADPRSRSVQKWQVSRHSWTIARPRPAACRCWTNWSVQMSLGCRWRWTSERPTPQALARFQHLIVRQSMEVWTDPKSFAPPASAAWIHCYRRCARPRAAAYHPVSPWDPDRCAAESARWSRDLDSCLTFGRLLEDATDVAAALCWYST